MANIYHTTVPVNLDTVEDCSRMGQLTELSTYLAALLHSLDKGNCLELMRYPVNSGPVSYGFITTESQFEKWTGHFL